MKARILKFHRQILQEKIVDPYFFSCPSYAPLTLKKLEGHIAFGLSVCLSVCLSLSVCASVVMYDSYLLKDVHSVLVNFPREYAQESMMLYI